MKKVMTILGIFLMVYTLIPYKVFPSNIKVVTTKTPGSPVTVVGVIEPGLQGRCPWRLMVFGGESYVLFGGDEDLRVIGQIVEATGYVGTTFICTASPVPVPDPSFEVVSYKILLSPCRCPTDSANGCISGTVANSAGEPIAGKTVVLKKRGPFGWKKIKTAVTEGDGCYRFTDLKDGRYRVRVRDCEGGGRKIVVINSGTKVDNVNFQCR